MYSGLFSIDISLSFRILSIMRHSDFIRPSNRPEFNKCRQPTAKPVTCFAKKTAKYAPALAAAAAGVQAVGKLLQSTKYNGFSGKITLFTVFGPDSWLIY